jgi:zinc D-Ala-D-Ala carboxypeptidase
MPVIATHNVDTFAGPWRWANFTPRELASKDNGSLVFSTVTLDRLQKLRHQFGRPLIVTSGYRTPEHNAKVSTTGRTGPHTTGRAVDVKCLDSQTRFMIVSLALSLGFTGVGIAPTFIHLDDVPPGTVAIPRPMLWLY